MPFGLNWGVDWGGSGLLDWEFTYNDFLFGGNQEFGLMEVAGLDMPTVREDTTAKAGLHGSYVFGAFLSERRLVLHGDVAGDPSTFETVLDGWRSAFLPRRTILPLSFKRPGSDIRFVNCIPIRAHLPIDVLYNLGYAEWQVELVAADPRIYSSTLNNGVVLPTAASVSGETFSVTFSINFGGGASGTSSLMNSGIFPAPFLARFDGPISDPQVKNVTTGEFIKLNTDIPTGQFMIIDTLEKTIKLGGTASRYHTLDPGSRWWSLLPGANDVLFSGAGTDGNSKLTMTWRSTWI